RRQQAHCFSASARMEFAPRNFQHMAGLIHYYNSSKFHYLYVSRNENGRYVRVMSCLPDLGRAEDATAAFPLPGEGWVELRIEVDHERLYFGHRVDDHDWQWMPQQFDAS